METVEKPASCGMNVLALRVSLDTEAAESIGPARQGAGGRVGYVGRDRGLILKAG
jgi:hypothetical protein